MAIVQQKTGAINDGVTFDTAVTAGNSIVVLMAYRTDDVTLTVTDTVNGATYSNALGHFFHGNGAVQISYKASSAAGTPTVTANPPSLPGGTMTLFELSGMDTGAGFVSGSAEGSVTDTSSPFTPGLSITPADASTMLFVVASDMDNDARVCTGGSGDITNGVATGTAGCNYGYATLSSGGAKTAGLTMDAGDTFAMQAYAFKIAGATSYTLTADSGSFIETGIAAGLIKANNITGATATFTLTGIAANLNYNGAPTNYTLTAQLGQFIQNGYDVTLTYAVANYFTWDRVTGNEGYRIEWGQTSGGPYPNTSDNTTNDETLTLLLPYRTTWYVRVAALVGGVPQDYTAERVMTSGIPDLNPEVGSFTLTGIANTLAVGKVLTATSRSYTETGIAANLVKTSILPLSVGSYTFTGNDAALTYTPSGTTYILSAETGNIVYTGINNSLLVGYGIVADTTPYTLTASNATLFYSLSSTGSSGSIIPGLRMKGDLFQWRVT